MIKTPVITTFLGLMTSLLLASPTFAATLALSPSSGVIGRGCAFSVEVLVDTQSIDSNSVDVVLNFDPQQFSVSSVADGTIFSDFPGNKIDNQTGRVSIYALSAQNTSFNGKGTIATVNFVASSSATLAIHPVSFDFDPSNPAKTTDSNVIQTGTTTDMLKSVTNGNYTITSTNCDQTSMAQGQAEASDSSTVSSLPGTGTLLNTWLFLTLGFGFSLLGLFGLLKEFKRTGK